MTQDSARKEVDRERNCTPLNFFSENHKASNHEKTKLLILDTKKPVGVQLGYKKYVPQWGYSPQKTIWEPYRRTWNCLRCHGSLFQAVATPKAFTMRLPKARRHHRSRCKIRRKTDVCQNERARSVRLEAKIAVILGHHSGDRSVGN